MSDNETQKPWYESSGVWGGLIAVVAGLAGVFGYTVTPENQEAITAGVTAFAGAIGGLIAVYGRIRASKAIKK